MPLSAVTFFLFALAPSAMARCRSQRGDRRVDFGLFSFFRGDRNWFILGTEGEPLILSVDDGLVAAFTQPCRHAQASRCADFNSVFRSSVSAHPSDL